MSHIRENQQCGDGGFLRPQGQDVWQLPTGLISLMQTQKEACTWTRPVRLKASSDSGINQEETAQGLWGAKKRWNQETTIHHLSSQYPANNGNFQTNDYLNAALHAMYHPWAEYWNIKYRVLRLTGCLQIIIRRWLPNFGLRFGVFTFSYSNISVLCNIYISLVWGFP